MKHTLEMTVEEKTAFRWNGVISGRNLFAICVAPELCPDGKISLFTFYDAKPVFISYVWFEMLDDEGVLADLLKNFLQEVQK